MVTAIAEPGTLTMRSARNSLGRVGHFDHPVLAHFEHPHLRSSAKAVFHRAQQAVGLVAVAFQVDHRVNDMLEHARPGNNAFLGDMANDEYGHAGILRQVAQPAGAFAHLGHRPGG